ncbi:MAG: recombination protein RecR [Kofleriaceae bacterium]|nr:recombination protein RecR [Kofleriaceae bacterium]MCL4226819.1 recombination mediator RecR [Myxococcales bacterium]
MADLIQRLVAELARLPGIGEKTATRLAMHLIRAPRPQVRELAQALLDATEKIGLCSVCATLTETDPCRLCADPRREAELICVVAQPSDVLAIERGGHFRGRYHVLHGVLSPLEGIGPDELRIAELIRRLGPARAAASGDPGHPAVGEVIIATAPTVEGEATAMYLARLIKPLGVKVSRIATGLPVGGDLEYTDQATIARALAGRSTL